MLRKCIAAGALWIAVQSSAQACSVSDDYRVPTNLELTQDAALILLARVESGSTDINDRDMSLTVTPLEVLKGKLPSMAPMQIPGMLAPERFAVKSKPAELKQAHPLAYIGGCFRYMFVKGSTVLFFLKPLEGEGFGPFKGAFGPAGGPFSRTAEDVPSAAAPWVRATRVYLKVAALPKDKQAAALHAERAALLSVKDLDAKVVAAEIERQLAGPNKPWNQLMDEEISKMKGFEGKEPQPR